MPATTTDPAVALALWMQLHDSAFPTGRMVHSQGLEQWLIDHPGADRVDIEHVVIAYLTNSYAPLDATISAAAWRATNDLQALRELDDVTASYKLHANARASSESSGRQLAAASRHSGLAGPCRYLDAVLDRVTPGHCAVVEGALQARLGIPVHVAVLGSLRSMMASMLSAAIRLGRLGPLHSQQIQTRCVPVLVMLARDACERGTADVWSVAPTLEISGMRHETRTGRLFTT